MDARPRPTNDKERAGIQSVEVGFALLDVLAQAPAPLMLRDLAAAADMSAAQLDQHFAQRGPRERLLHSDTRERASPH